MRIRTTRLETILLLACFTLFISAPTLLHAQTYYLLSNPGIPYPVDPYDGAVPIVTLDAVRQIYQIEDNTNAYALITEAHELDAMSATSADSIDPTGGAGSGTNSSGGGFSPNNASPGYGPNDLLVQVLQIDEVNQLAFLQFTNTIPGDYYQLLSTTTLSTNEQGWTLGDFFRH